VRFEALAGRHPGSGRHIHPDLKGFTMSITAERKAALIEEYATNTR
jgi:hypothetical protein